MKDSIKIWLPIDTNVNDKSYQIPSIENQKDTLFNLFNATATEQAENTESDGEDNHFYGNVNQEQDPRDNKMKDFLSQWIDVMSFSHNVSNSEGRRGKGEAHIGEFTLTKYTCDRSPSLNYMSLRGELIPHIIVRINNKMKVGSNILPILEYELHHCNITNVSISGGTGGRPVETLSINCKIFTAKNVKVNLDNGDFSNYQVSKWDILKGTGAKTIYSQEGSAAKGGDATLLELAKKHLMVDLDSHEPQTIALLKELNIISEYELSDKSIEDEVSIEELCRVQINKEPNLFKVIEINKKEFTFENVKKTIANKLDIPVDTVKNLYCYDRRILLENEKLLKLTKNFILQTTDDKFYGH